MGARHTSFSDESRSIHPEVSRCSSLSSSARYRRPCYQERRLRGLNLLDADGSSTYDPFNDGIA